MTKLSGLRRWFRIASIALIGLFVSVMIVVLLTPEVRLCACALPPITPTVTASPTATPTMTPTP